MPLRSALIAATLAAVFGAGWAVNGWRLDGALQALTAKHDRERLTQSDAARVAAEAAHERELALTGELADIDRARTADNRTAKNEIDTLRARLANGSVGLRVAATCPDARPVELPGPADRGGVDTRTAPRLTADAEQAYIALREGITTQRVQLAACVEALGRITAPTSAPTR